MNESEKMTDLILEAYQKCKDQGHRMDWRRYNNYEARADCIDCNMHTEIYNGVFEDQLSGSALTTKCKGR